MAILIGLLLYEEGCEQQPVDATVRVEVGDPQVRQARVELFRGDELAPVAFFERRFDAGEPAGAFSQVVRLPEGAYTARVALVTEAGVTAVERTLHVEDGRVISLNLAPQ